MDRRKFLSAGALAAAGSAVGTQALAQAAGGQPPLPRPHPEILVPMIEVPPAQRYRISYTTNTRGGWEGDPFKGMAEAREVGFRYMEIFGASFARGPNAYYPNDYERLQHKIFQMGVQFCSITGGAPGGATAFEDPAQRQAVIDNHFEMARFSRRFGGLRWKTNLGRRRPGGTTDEDLRHMAETCNQLGRRMREDLGMHLGIHPHLNSQLQDERETLYMMANTDPRYVGLVLDTGHITMAGMDPLALAKKFGKRVIEFHFKDVDPKDRGGTKNVPGPEVDMMKTPYFFPLGKGGVDFKGLLAYLDSIQWEGFLNVELDTSPFEPPKEGARKSAAYITNVLKIPL